jgi:integrase
MASLSNDSNGGRRIQFVDATGNRKAIRLGNVSKKQAESFLAWTERLIASHSTGTAIDPQTAAWLTDLPDTTYAKLVRVGLAEAREDEDAYTLKDLVTEAFAGMNVKETTLTRYKQTRRLLYQHFGEDADITMIGPREADQWRASLIEANYADAKVAKEVTIARMLFKQAVRWGWIPSNPFDGIRAGSQTNRDRLYYLTPEDAHKLIDAAPSADWRCVIALARFGGLRCPSEVLGVRWADVDWAKNRMLVRSPKTERHGKAERTVPLFPELREVLIEAFELAPEGAEHVVGTYRDAQSANLRTQLVRIIERAGLTAWPRLFNAMRASRATELAAKYPAAVCTAWMGHTQAVAQSHYHMVRDSDYEHAAATSTLGSGAETGARAAQKPAQQAAAASGKERNPDAQTQEGPELMPVPAALCRSLENGGMGLDRFELSTSPLSGVRSNQLSYRPGGACALRRAV